MSIRKFNKDHLSPNFDTSASSISPKIDHASLSFWTLHKKPIFVDLNVFREGEATRKGHGPWNGPFTGRLTLIEQLFPAIKGTSEYASPQTISRLIATLRYWWRLFDELERQNDLARVTTVSEIGELHRQFAIDKNIDPNHFRKLIQIANITRLSLGLRRLYWNSPEPSKPIRNIAARWHFDQIRFLLKHQWYATFDRWQRADELMNGHAPTTKDEQRLQAGYLLLQSAIANSGRAKPDRHAIRGSLSYSEFNDRGRGHAIGELFRGFYPDGDDIRNAFHLCLATTGWNAAVLISIDANEDFIEPHPKDSARYLMRGFKERGKSEPIAEGLFKSQGSAGFIMKTIISRTAPLREELRQQLEQLRKSVKDSSPQNLNTQDLNALRQNINQLEEGVKSPWLYVTGVSKEILWLDNFNFSKGGPKFSSSTFLDRCIEKANSSRPPERQITRIKPGDLTGC